MTEAQIKLKRTESLLLELVPAALSSLGDVRLHALDIIDVKCSRGRSDAKVFIHPSSYTQQEKNEFIKLLKNARPIVETYCMKNQGWFRSPRLTFEFDEQFQQSQTLEELFKKIAKE